MDRYHLATTHADEYSKIVLESSSRTTGDECPFARSSIALVNVLCEILKIGEPPSDQQGKFYPFFFQHVILIEKFKNIDLLIFMYLCIFCPGQGF